MSTDHFLLLTSLLARCHAAAPSCEDRSLTRELAGRVVYLNGKGRAFCHTTDRRSVLGKGCNAGEKRIMK